MVKSKRSQLFHYHNQLWLALKNKTFNVKEASNALGFSIETARVILNRMKKDLRLVTPKRGRYKLVKPKQWIELYNLEVLNIPFGSELRRDLTQHAEHIRAVVLHGSWVKGDSTGLSDVDVLIISDSQLTELTEKYRHPVSIDVQPSEGYEKIFVKEALQTGEIIYDDGILAEIKKTKILKKDYLKKLDETRSNLFKLDDNKLFESLTLIDLAHLLYSNLRSLEIVEKNLKGKVKKPSINPEILKEAEHLYKVSKAGRRRVPQITRSQIRKLKNAVIQKWYNIRVEVDTWEEKRN